MNKTVLLTLVLVVLIAVTAVIAWQRQDRSHTYDTDEGNFAVGNIEDVHKVVLTHRDGNVFTLRKTAGGWLLNDTYRARMSSIQPMLDALREVRIRYMPTRAAYPNIMNDIEALAIHVQIYDRNDRLLKHYLVGGVSPDERGTYMLMDGATQPFVMHIPHWDGSLRPRFTLLLEDWRDRRFMDISPEDIQSVSVDYLSQRTQSFLLERRVSGFSVTPLHPGLRDYPDSYRPGTAEAYLAALAGAACEGYESAYPKKDSIRNTVPFCIIQVQRRSKPEPIDLIIWPQGQPVYSPFSPPIHRLYIDKPPSDFLLAQYLVVRDILRGYDYFHTGEDATLIF